MTRRIPRLLLTPLLTLLAALGLVVAGSQTSLAATTKYVSPGDDLVAAIKTLKPGDTLVLRNGTYPAADRKIPPVRGTASAPITIRAENPRGATIIGHTQFTDPDYVHIKNLRFTNPNGVGSKRIAVIIGGTGWLFEGNEVFGGSYSGLLVGKSTTYGAVHQYTIRGNWIHDVGSSNLYHNPGPDSTRGLIERNVFSGAGGNGSNAKLGWGGSGGCTDEKAATFGVGEVEFRYNTLHGGSRHPLTIAERGGELPVKVHHNLVTGQTGTYSVRIDNVEGCLSSKGVEVDDNAYSASTLAYDAGDAPGILAKMDRNVKVSTGYSSTSNGFTGFAPTDATAAKYGARATS